MIETQILILIFLLSCTAGIVLTLLLPVRSSKTLAFFGGLAGIALTSAGLTAWLANGTFVQTLWILPELGKLTVHVDRLSAVFLFITGVVFIPSSVFAGEELERNSEQYHGRALTILLLGLYVSIAFVLMAGDALLFLFSWEGMSILCYLLLMSSRQRTKDHVSAGYLLLAMGEAGTLAAALGLLLLAVHANSLSFSAFKSASLHLNVGLRWSVFLLTFLGFGVKAGLVPVNSWLPRAYTAAPKAFVPILAGATLNLGLYGILRTNVDILPTNSVGPGLVVLIIGTVSAFLGILYATTENNLKTMLAHSSIENAGIICAGFGAGMVFVAAHHPALAAIAFVTALYHLLNHSLYKTLLFLGAGNVETQTNTCDLDQLGGLMKVMPITACAMLTGALSIAALPPFNGFVSEWLTLQTMLRSSELASIPVKLIFVLCGAGLALTAALAVTCFAKMFAMGFLGMRRLDENKKVKEARSSSWLPMAFLGVLCLAFGVLPTYIVPALGQASDSLAGANAATVLVPPFFSASPEHHTLPPDFMTDFHNLGAQVGQSIVPGRGLVVLHRGGTENPVVFAMSTAYMFLALVLLLLLVYVTVQWLTHRRTVTRQERWDGGVRRLFPEMTYTATGFSNPVRVIFDAIFRPTTVEDTQETVAEHFRTAIRRKKQNVHPADKIAFQPIKFMALRIARYLAAMHNGRINVYAAYVLVALLLVLALGLFWG